MKTQFPTLDQIREVVREEVKNEGKTIMAAFHHDLKLLKGRVNSVEDSLKVEITDLQKEMNQRFDENNDTHQELIGAIDEICDRKVTKHCQKYHGVVT
ncbi:hypothetical protein HY310_00575 [Candidatus Microgenomates bacterium]|nr:hypothetical protein [Candidatus Microgenomates bacterium]